MRNKRLVRMASSGASARWGPDSGFLVMVRCYDRKSANRYSDTVLAFPEQALKRSRGRRSDLAARPERAAARRLESGKIRDFGLPSSTVTASTPFPITVPE